MHPDLAPPRRILLGPGPSEAHPRVLKALATPLVGYFDPYFLAIMDRVQQMLRAVFQTQNPVTFPISGTGNLGMEAAFANLIEPGDTAVIGVNGVFGGRMADNVERHGGRVVMVEAPWGEIVPQDRMAQAIRDVRPKVVGVVHAETSTGVCQPLEEIAAAARETGALLVVDCVTSLSGVPIPVDAWGIDVAHSGSQKCLNCPPGLAPITFSERAIEAVRARKTKVASYSVDVALLSQHWAEGSTQRTYHHTPPTSLIFALYEALRIVLEEGLEPRFERHKLSSEALVAGLQAMGLEMASQEGHRLWTLNAVRIPEGIDEAKVRAQLLSEHSIEIGAGLGPLKGQVWRIGLMGRCSSRSNVLAVLGALDQALGTQGFSTPGSGVEAALEQYRKR
jgi:alanine-glyoxylate transaminase/serine-glyoxylate transaminase/serine-pyruvate transaminase